MLTQAARRALEPSKIGVVVTGFPSERAKAVAKLCKQRGYLVSNFGLATNDAQQNQIDVEGVGKINLCRFTEGDARSKLNTAVKDLRKSTKQVIVADVTDEEQQKSIQNCNVTMYNDLEVPFVMQSGARAVEQTQLAKQRAVISEEMDKTRAAIDSMFQDFGSRFPGLFQGFESSFRSTDPRSSLSMLSSFSDLLNKDLTKMENISEEEAKKMNVIQGTHTSEYNLRNGSGSSSFSFRTTYSPDTFAEGIADSVEYLANSAEQMNRPRVFNILDVMERPLMLGW